MLSSATGPRAGGSGTRAAGSCASGPRAAGSCAVGPRATSSVAGGSCPRAGDPGLGPGPGPGPGPTACSGGPAICSMGQQ